MKYKVTGAHRETGKEMTIEVEAPNFRAAEDQASELGLFVADVSEVHEPSPVVVRDQAPVQAAPPQAYVQPHPHPQRPIQIEMTPKRSNSLGKTSLIVGILAFLICWVPFISVVSMPLSAVGLLLAAIGFLVGLTRRGYGVGYPIGGAAINGMALVIAAVTGLGMFAAAGGAAEGIAKAAEQAREMQERNLGVAATEERSIDAPAPEWLDSTQIAQVNDFSVSIDEVYVGNPIFRTSMGAEAPSSQVFLVIALTVTNTSAATKHDYRTWRSTASYDSSGKAALSDAAGNTYKRVSGSLSSTPIGAAKGTTSLYPGDSVGDVLIFERPVRGAEYLILELPGSRIGEIGVVRFRITADRIDWRAD